MAKRPKGPINIRQVVLMLRLVPENTAGRIKAAKYGVIFPWVVILSSQDATQTRSTRSGSGDGRRS